jgi:hypothetical protein
LKLIGGKAQEYLNSILDQVNAAPSSHQNKICLVEWQWQTHHKIDLLLLSYLQLFGFM